MWFVTVKPDGMWMVTAEPDGMWLVTAERDGMWIVTAEPELYSTQFSASATDWKVPDKDKRTSPSPEPPK
jgi:hypothetical protein